MKLLITGVPGAGKTCMGEYLKSKHSFIHIDLEKDARLANLVHSTDEFIKTLPESNIVLTWGFMPKDDNLVRVVLNLKSNGFKIIWFDGNREASKREFIKRGTVPLDAYDIQIRNIDESQIVKMIDPIIYNTFDESGDFKSSETIYQEVSVI